MGWDARATTACGTRYPLAYHGVRGICRVGYARAARMSPTRPRSSRALCPPLRSPVCVRVRVCDVCASVCACVYAQPTEPRTRAGIVTRGGQSAGPKHGYPVVPEYRQAVCRMRGGQRACSQCDCSQCDCSRLRRSKHRSAVRARLRSLYGCRRQTTADARHGPRGAASCIR